MTDLPLSSSPALDGKRSYRTPEVALKFDGATLYWASGGL